MTDKYNEQAKEFLAFTDTKIEIFKAVPQKPPLWMKEGESHGVHYSVTLANSKGRYTFDFWGSIHDMHHGKRPTAYSILACLDILYEDSFEDFCASFGYEEDSRKAEETYEAVKEQSNNLKRIFTTIELEKLAEIA